MLNGGTQGVRASLAHKEVLMFMFAINAHLSIPVDKEVQECLN